MDQSKSADQTFGQYVRAIRVNELHLSQPQFAEQAHMTEGLVSLIERDCHSQWGPKTLDRLALALERTVMELRKRLPPQNLKPPKTPLGKTLEDRRLELYLTREEVAAAAGRTYREIAALERGDILGLQSKEIPLFANILKLGEDKLTPFLSAHQKYEVLPRHKKFRPLVSEPGIRQKKIAWKRTEAPRPPRPPAKIGRPPKVVTVPKPKPEPRTKVQNTSPTPAAPPPPRILVPTPIKVAPSDDELDRLVLLRRIHRARQYY